MEERDVHCCTTPRRSKVCASLLCVRMGGMAKLRRGYLHEVSLITAQTPLHTSLQSSGTQGNGSTGTAQRGGKRTQNVLCVMQTTKTTTNIYISPDWITPLGPAKTNSADLTFLLYPICRYRPVLLKRQSSVGRARMPPSLSRRVWRDDTRSPSGGERPTAAWLHSSAEGESRIRHL